MLSFDLFCAADTFDEGGYTQMSGCGIVCILRSDDKLISKFKFGYPLGSSGYNLAVANSIRLGIMSIHKKYRNQGSSLQIFSDERILKLLSDDAIIDLPDCELIILEIRDSIRPFGFKTSYFDLDSDYMLEAKEIASICQTSQRKFRG